MEFPANENFPPASIQHLREVGYRVISMLQEAAGAKDEDILKRAHEESLIILTFDQDYGELLFRHQALPPASVVYFRFSPAFCRTNVPIYTYAETQVPSKEGFPFEVAKIILFT
jgi:predicted nuclease of predicted toxin-antitoxin system